jgi:hypothetical protein
MRDVTLRRGVAGDEALKRLRRLPDARIRVADKNRRVVELTWLHPHQLVTDPIKGEHQDVILTRFLSAYPGERRCRSLSGINSRWRSPTTLAPGFFGPGAGMAASTRFARLCSARI